MALHLPDLVGNLIGIAFSAFLFVSYLGSLLWSRNNTVGPLHLIELLFVLPLPVFSFLLVVLFALRLFRSARAGKQTPKGTLCRHVTHLTCVSSKDTHHSHTPFTSRTCTRTCVGVFAASPSRRPLLTTLPPHSLQCNASASCSSKYPYVQFNNNIELTNNNCYCDRAHKHCTQQFVQRSSSPCSTSKWTRW